LVEPVPALAVLSGVVALAEADGLALAAESPDGVVTVVDEELLEAGGVVVPGVTTVVSRDAVVVGAGVVDVVVVLRSHAARAVPRVRAAMRGISFMFAPVVLGGCIPH
jgi:hypothetical protein